MFDIKSAIKNERFRYSEMKYSSVEIKVSLFSIICKKPKKVLDKIRK